MATVTAPTRVMKGIAEYAGEGPKWRMEHASNGRSGCQQAACKRAGIKIEKGELRIGTHTLFDRDGENRWYIAWRHWGCATKFQIEGLKAVTEDDPTKAPGYDRLNSDAQEQVRQAFENGNVVDKTFKGVNNDLAKVPKRYGGEIYNATGYKADVATRGTAACRNADCPEGATKIAKGELRLGLSVPFDGDHESWQYKHWKCVSQYDLEAIQAHYKDDTFDGVDVLPDDYKTIVIETIEKGEVIAPPKPEPAPAKKSKKSKKKTEDNGSEAEAPEPEQKSKVKVEENNGEIEVPELEQESRVKIEESNREAEAPKPEPEPERKSMVKIEENNSDAEVLKLEPDPQQKSKMDTEEGNSEVEAPKLKQKSKAKGKKKAEDAQDKDNHDDDGAENSQPKPKPKPKVKGRKRSSEELDDSSEPEYVPRKTRSRAAPLAEFVSI